MSNYHLKSFEKLNIIDLAPIQEETIVAFLEAELFKYYKVEYPKHKELIESNPKFAKGLKDGGLFDGTLYYEKYLDLLQELPFEYNLTSSHFEDLRYYLSCALYGGYEDYIKGTILTRPMDSKFLGEIKINIENTRLVYKNPPEYQEKIEDDSLVQIHRILYYGWEMARQGQYKEAKDALHLIKDCLMYYSYNRLPGSIKFKMRPDGKCKKKFFHKLHDVEIGQGFNSANYARYLKSTYMGLFYIAVKEKDYDLAFEIEEKNSIMVLEEGFLHSTLSRSRALELVIEAYKLSEFLGLKKFDHYKEKGLEMLKRTINRDCHIKEIYPGKVHSELIKEPALIWTAFARLFLPEK